jgi:hypothetical protein
MYIFQTKLTNVHGWRVVPNSLAHMGLLHFYRYYVHAFKLLHINKSFFVFTEKKMLA